MKKQDDNIKWSTFKNHLFNTIADNFAQFELELASDGIDVDNPQLVKNIRTRFFNMNFKNLLNLPIVHDNFPEIEKCINKCQLLAEILEHKASDGHYLVVKNVDDSQTIVIEIADALNELYIGDNIRLENEVLKLLKCAIDVRLAISACS